jgi:hypothetical protein
VLHYSRFICIMLRNGFRYGPRYSTERLQEKIRVLFKNCQKYGSAKKLNIFIAMLKYIYEVAYYFLHFSNYSRIVFIKPRYIKKNYWDV